MNLGKTLKIHTGVCEQFLLLHYENTKWPNVHECFDTAGHCTCLIPLGWILWQDNGTP